MNWICVATNIKNDVSVAHIANECKVRIAEAVGLATNVYCDLPKNARDGDLSAVPDVLIEQWARWEGKRGVFAKSFRKHLCTDEGLVRSWEKYNGAAIRESDANIERVREWRKNRQKKPHSTGDVTPSVRRTKRVTNTVANGVTNADRTAVDVDVDKELTATPPGGGVAVSHATRDRVREALSDPLHQAAFDRQLRASRAPDVLVLELEALARERPSDGTSGLAWSVIGQALHELSVDGKRANSGSIRSFAETIQRRERGEFARPARSAPTSEGDDEAAEEARLLERIKAGEFLTDADRAEAHADV